MMRLELVGVVFITLIAIVLQTKSLKYLGIIILILNIGKAASALDPCTNYKNLLDTTMTSDERLRFGEPPSTDIQPPGWTRYSATISGSLMTECPTSSECKVFYQFWMNDTLPSEGEGITTVNVCGRSGPECCNTPESLRVKNCSDFVVYDLKPVTNGVRYCFLADPKTTTSTRFPTTVYNNGSRMEDDVADSVNITMIAVIAGVVLFAVVVVIIVCVFVRKKLAKRSVGYIDETGKEWETLNIAAIYRSKRKDLLIPRLVYLSGKQKTNSSMVYLNPKDDDFVDMNTLNDLPRSRSELEIFSLLEIDRLGMDISAVYQTRMVDTFISNTKFSTKRKQGNHVVSVFDVGNYFPYTNMDKVKFY